MTRGGRPPLMKLLPPLTHSAMLADGPSGVGSGGGVVSVVSFVATIFGIFPTVALGGPWLTLTSVGRVGGGGGGGRGFDTFPLTFPVRSIVSVRVLEFLWAWPLARGTDTACFLGRQNELCVYV